MKWKISLHQADRTIKIQNKDGVCNSISEGMQKFRRLSKSLNTTFKFVSIYDVKTTVFREKQNDKSKMRSM